MSNSTTPRVMPDISGLTPMRAALAYARAGMYVLPVQPGSKNPGSVVGGDWPAHSTLDEAVIREWWGRNPKYGIAIHAGRSGLVVFDVDNPEEVPETWFDFLRESPCNTTRRGDVLKGHYFFLQPPDKVLGNGKTGLSDKAWGDIRGSNGIVIAPPSKHPDAKEGGLYRQRRGGEIHHLPKFITDQLQHADPGQYALTDLQWKKFLKENARTQKPKMVVGIEKLYARRMDEGESRHTTAVECLCWGFRESRAGYYPADDVEQRVRELFVESLSAEGNERFPGEGEWRDIVRWAAAQAYANTPDEIRDTVEARDRRRQEERTADGLYRPKLGTGTDQEHAHEVIRWISDRIKYATDGAVWIMKDGDRWRANPDMDAGGVVATVADEMPLGEKADDKIQDEWTDEQREANFDYENRQRYQNSATAARIATKVQKLVSSRTSDFEYTLRLSDLDKDPFVLWTPRGPVDLLPDRHADHNIDLMAVHQHCTRVPMLEVETPCWDGMLEAIWPDDAVRAWALQNLAVGFTGEPEKMFVYLYGDQDRGKSSVPTLLADVLGSYGRSDLGNNIVSADAQPWERAQLHGLWFAYVDETPNWRGKALDQLKTLTGGESEIIAAYKNKQPFKFDPTHTFIFSSNEDPALTDPAVRRRLRVVPCTGNPRAVRAARAKLGSLKGPVWQREAPGVLWQMVQLARKYATNPDVIHESSAPALVKAAERELYKDQDLFTEWVEEWTLRIPEDRSEEWCTAKEIYDTFATWCIKPRARDYLKHISPQKIGIRLGSAKMKKMGIQKKELRGRKVVWNVDMNPARVKR